MTPARIWNVEVFPAPSGPISPKISPSATSRSMPAHRFDRAVALRQAAHRIAAARLRSALGDRPAARRRRVSRSRRRRPSATRRPRRESRRRPACRASRSPTAPRELQLDADDLLDAILPEVGVLGREGRLRVDARRRPRRSASIGARVEVDARRLTDLHAADLAFGHEPAQVHLPTGRRSVTIGVPAATTSPGSAVRVTMVPSNGATTFEVAAVRPCLLELGAGPLGVGLRRRRCRPAAWTIWPWTARHLRRADGRVRELARAAVSDAARRVHLALRRGDDRRLASRSLFSPARARCSAIEPTRQSCVYALGVPLAPAA